MQAGTIRLYRLLPLPQVGKLYLFLGVVIFAAMAVVSFLPGIKASQSGICLRVVGNAGAAVLLVILFVRYRSYFGRRKF